MFPQTLRQILVPVDFSPPSDHALSSAVTMARATGASVVLLHVIHQPHISAGLSPLGLNTGELLSSLERSAHLALADRVDRLGREGVTGQSRVLHGSPHVEIARAIAEQPPDLVVMSTHGWTGLKHAAMGSVAERVLQRARCPVLVVPACCMPAPAVPADGSEDRE